MLSKISHTQKNVFSYMWNLDLSVCVCMFVSHGNRMGTLKVEEEIQER